MPQYQLWIEDNTYAKLALLTQWSALTYQQKLNGMGSCQVTLRPDDAKITYIDACATAKRRVKIIRNGTIVFGGMICRANWNIDSTAPEGEVYTFHAVDHAAYAKWRLTDPGAGNEYQTYTDHRDDVLKDFVYNCMGAGAVAARQLADVTIAADAHGAASTTISARYENLLNVLTSEAYGFVDWRFVPGASGCTFTTGVPLGTDRTQGNGVNAECVWTTDRRNVESMEWLFDALEMANYIYCGGQGEGVNRNVQERTTAGSVTAYWRREKFVEARQLSVTAAIQARGDAALAESAYITTMNAQPLATTWKAASGTTWDLGDKVTILSKQYRTFSYNGKATGIDVTVTPSGDEVIEVVKPSLEAC